MQEMSKFCKFFIGLIIAAATVMPADALTVKKSEPVAASQNTTATTSSIVPAVIGLITNVVALNQQQNLMSKECEPSPSEITFVNNVVKEWAKVGRMTHEEMGKELKRDRCQHYDGFRTDSALVNNVQGMEPCYNWANDPGKIWHEYPQVGSALVCKKGGVCPSDRDKDMVTDIYDIFYLVDFDPQDYNKTEATMATRLLEKMDNCSAKKLSARRRALWGDFIATTAGGLGQQTDTRNIMEQIGGIVQTGSSGLGVNALSSIGGIATQMMAQ